MLHAYQALLYTMSFNECRTHAQSGWYVDSTIRMQQHFALDCAAVLVLLAWRGYIYPTSLENETLAGIF